MLRYVKILARTPRLKFLGVTHDNDCSFHTAARIRRKTRLLSKLKRRDMEEKELINSTVRYNDSSHS